MPNRELSAETVGLLPIRWHATAPRCFECQPGCVCCCVATLVFPSEAETMPEEIRDSLTWRQGFLRIPRRPPGVCIFFDESTPQHCGIFQDRPLRCRLYPYLPLVTREGIVIVADPLATVSFPETDSPAWYRCYGLGRGANVETSVEKMSRDFLERVIQEYPGLLADLCVEDVDKCINPKEVEKSLHPLFTEWDTEAITRTSRQSEVS